MASDTDATYTHALINRNSLHGRIPGATGHDDVLARATVYYPITEHPSEPDLSVLACISGGYGRTDVAMGQVGGYMGDQTGIDSVAIDVQLG